MGKDSKTKQLDKIKNDPTVKKIIDTSKIFGGKRNTTCNGVIPQ